MRHIPTFIIPDGYCAQSPDTHPEADALEFYLLRQRSASDRLQMAAHAIRNARQLSLHSLSQHSARLSFNDFARKVAETWLQEDCPQNYIPTGCDMTWIQDSIELATQLHQIFTTLRIDYYITGGVAAIAYGEPRTTRDLDVVISLPKADLDSFVSALEAEGFYVPGVDDVRSGHLSILQITQIETISRADLILVDLNTDRLETIETQNQPSTPKTPQKFEHQRFERRRLCEFPNGTSVFLSSPEDVILSKLQWGQRHQSEKQWRDVLGILKTQQDTLDFKYLRKNAVDLQLSTSLEQLLVQAGVTNV